MDFTTFFDKLAEDGYIYPSEEIDPRKKFLSVQGTVLGGISGYLARNKIKDLLERDSTRTVLQNIISGSNSIKNKTIYHPSILPKLIKHSPILSTLGGALAGSAALKTLYNLSE